MNNFYRTDHGGWINLSLYHRFFLQTVFDEGKPEFNVVACMDLSQDEEVAFPISGPFKSRKDAQVKLDRIMRGI
jgi:hypothetical protein